MKPNTLFGPRSKTDAEAAQYLYYMDSPGMIKESVARLYYKDRELRKAHLERDWRAEMQRHSHNPSMSPIKSNHQQPAEDQRLASPSPAGEKPFASRYDEDLRKRRQNLEALERKYYLQEKKVIDKKTLKQFVERLHDRPMKIRSTEQRKDIKQRQQEMQAAQERGIWAVRHYGVGPLWGRSKEDGRALLVAKVKQVPKSQSQAPRKRAQSADHIARLSTPRIAVPLQKKKEKKPPNRSRTAEPRGKLT